MKNEDDNEARLQADHASITRSMLDILLSWSAVEVNFARILATFMREDVFPSREEAATKVLAAVISSDSQLNMIDELVKVRLKGKIEIDGTNAINLTDAWDGLIKRLKSKKSTRNLVAHGTLVWCEVDSKAAVRLAPSYYPGKKGAEYPYGRSANELKSTADQFRGDVNLIAAFSQYLTVTTPANDQAASTTSQDYKKAQAFLISHIKAAPGYAGPSVGGA